jgi:hypothetical protein
MSSLQHKTEKINFILKNTLFVISKQDGYWTHIFNIKYYKKAIYDLYLILFFDIFMIFYGIFLDNLNKYAELATISLLLIAMVNLLFYWSHVRTPKLMKKKILKYGNELFGNDNIYEIYQLAQREPAS